MSEVLEVIWSPLAEETYLRAIEFILEKWTANEAIALDKKVESIIAKLSSYKNLCPPSKIHKDLRRCVISSQTSLVYRIIDKRTIELVTFFDNRSEHQY